MNRLIAILKHPIAVLLCTFLLAIYLVRLNVSAQSTTNTTTTSDTAAQEAAQEAAASAAAAQQVLSKALDTVQTAQDVYDVEVELAQNLLEKSIDTPTDANKEAANYEAEYVSANLATLQIDQSYAASIQAYANDANAAANAAATAAANGDTATAVADAANASSSLTYANSNLNSETQVDITPNNSNTDSSCSHN